MVVLSSWYTAVSGMVVGAVSAMVRWMASTRLLLLRVCVASVVAMILALLSRRIPR
ncbi:MAG: hypothetical protein ACKVVP_06750 [Chloroflexota bacterium]